MNKARLLAVLACASLVAALSPAVQAQVPYPSRAITLVVPYPAGGSADVLARAIGSRLGERLGQPVIIENRAGAGTAIGAKFAAKAAPDGYTLLIGTVSSQAINPAVTKVGYDPLTDFTPIAPLASIPFVLVAGPAAPLSNVADLIALARSKPGALTYASAGPGTSNHLAGELLASQEHLKLLHVPYRGSAPALNDVLAGHVMMMFDLQATAMSHIQAGKLKALAVTSRERSSLLPTVPTMIEAGLTDFEVSAWFGLFAPAGLPRSVLDRLSAEIGATVKSADVVKLLRNLGAEPETATPEAYAAFVKAEAAKWADTVKHAGLSP